MFKNYLVSHAPLFAILATLFGASSAFAVDSASITNAESILTTASAQFELVAVLIVTITLFFVLIRLFRRIGGR